MRYWVGAFIACFLALLQASSIEQFRIIGVAPNLMLVLLASWLVVRGVDDVLPMIAVAGITSGLIGLQTPGLVLLAMMPLVGFGFVRELHVVHSELLLAVGLVFASTLAYETVLLFGVVATGGVFDVTTAFTRSILPSAVVNVALTPVVLTLMRFARPSAIRHRLSY